MPSPRTQVGDHLRDFVIGGPLGRRAAARPSDGCRRCSCAGSSGGRACRVGCGRAQGWARLERAIPTSSAHFLVDDRGLRERIGGQDRRGVELRVRGVEALDDHRDDAVGRTDRPKIGKVCSMSVAGAAARRRARATPVRTMPRAHRRTAPRGRPCVSEHEHFACGGRRLQTVCGAGASSTLRPSLSPTRNGCNPGVPRPS